jgi:mRNA interferase RelE/StbE
VSRYTIYIIPDALAEIRDLPGNMRQRVRRAIDALADQPRPSSSKALNLSSSQQSVAEPVVPGADEQLHYELRRLRLDRWRVVYAITEADQIVDVLAVRRRPPYDYGDLAALLEQL